MKKIPRLSLMMAALAIGVGGSSLWTETSTCPLCHVEKEAATLQWFRLPVWTFQSTTGGHAGCGHSHGFVRTHLSEKPAVLLGMGGWSHDTSEGVAMSPRLKAVETLQETIRRLGRQPELEAATLKIIEECYPIDLPVSERSRIPNRELDVLRFLRRTLEDAKSVEDWKMRLKTFEGAADSIC